MGSDVDDANFDALVSLGGALSSSDSTKRGCSSMRVTLPTYQLGGRLQPILTGMLGVMLALNCPYLTLQPHADVFALRTFSPAAKSASALLKYGV